MGNKNKMRIAVLGSGSFGTAMANLWHDFGHSVVLWGRDVQVIAEIQKQKTNSRYLPGQTLSGFESTTNLQEAIAAADCLVFAIPCQSLRAVLTQIKPLFGTTNAAQKIFINLAKGLEVNTCLWPHQIFAEVLGQQVAARFFALSGPTFSLELLQRTPTAAVLAGVEGLLLKNLQNDLSLPWFRLYSSNDVLGVEIAGATKNIFALAIGVLEGLNFGHNSRASFMTRCLFEMTQLGVALGAKATTFSGLSGLGDLILTCTGHLSRNRQVGVRLGKGESLSDILKSMTSVAEGVQTAKSIQQLVERQPSLQRLDLPNLSSTYRMLYENLSPKQALQELLSRPLRSEAQ